MIYTLRCIIFTVLLWVWSVSIGILFLPAMPFDNIVIKAGRVWASGIYFLLRICCGVTYEIRGKEYIKNAPFIYACKHQSAWETMIFWVLLEKPAWVLKQSLLWLPLVGLYMWRTGCIYIDRTGGSRTLKRMLARAKERLAESRPIIIYPEGTRVPVGAKPEYHVGITAFYAYLQVPVVPIALNSGLFWPKNSFMKRPGKVLIEFLPPISPGLKREEFMAQMREAIETATDKLVAEAQASFR